MFVVTLLLLSFCLGQIKCASFRQGLLEEEICETKECYDAAAHLKEWMNPAFKPCEDFYEYACGYWHTTPNNTTVKKVSNMSLGSRDKITNFHLKKLLLDDDVAEESRLFKMLKQFLTMCLDEEGIEARGVSPAVQALRNAGGWPVLEQDWSQENWSIENTKIAFGGGAFFDIKAEYYSRWKLEIDVIQPDVRISSVEDFSQAFQNESIQEYYKKGSELIQALGVNKGKAEQDMKEIVEFEIAFAQLVKEAKKPSGYFSTRYITLSKVQNHASWVNWTYVLNNLLPKSVRGSIISNNDTIAVRGLEVLEKMENFTNNYPKRTVANYAMWKLALTLTKYLPAKVRNLTKYFEPKDEDENPYESTDYKNRYEQCVAYVEESSLLGAAALYISTQMADDTKTAKEITQNILDELLKDISELDWLDGKTRSSAQKTLRETEIHISFPEEARDLNVVEEVYKEVNINTSYFFEAIMDNHHWIRKTRFEKLGTSFDSLSLQNKLERSLSLTAGYMLGKNTIVVSAGFLHFLPLFSSKVPAYVNYGHLGGVVAHELIHALDFETDVRHSSWSRYPDVSVKDYAADDDMAEHLMDRWGSNETEEIYDTKKRCIMDQYSSFNDTKYTGQKLNGNYTDREDVADNGGFKVALRAYRRMVSNLVSPEPRLPTLQQYSNEQLFILSLANTFCAIPDKEKLLDQMKYDPHSPFEFRVKGIMMNSPDFGELFHCQKNDPMNPVKKCEVW